MSSVLSSDHVHTLSAIGPKWSREQWKHHLLEKRALPGKRSTLRKREITERETENFLQREEEEEGNAQKEEEIQRGTETEIKENIS